MKHQQNQQHQNQRLSSETVQALDMIYNNDENDNGGVDEFGHLQEPISTSLSSTLNNHIALTSTLSESISSLSDQYDDERFNQHHNLQQDSQLDEENQKQKKIVEKSQTLLQTSNYQLSRALAVKQAIEQTLLEQDGKETGHRQQFNQSPFLPKQQPSTPLDRYNQRAMELKRQHGNNFQQHYQQPEPQYLSTTIPLHRQPHRRQQPDNNQFFNHQQDQHDNNNEDEDGYLLHQISNRVDELPLPLPSTFKTNPNINNVTHNNSNSFTTPKRMGK
jgi:hypothetical protein